GVNAIAVRTGDADVDLAEQRFGQAGIAGDLGPVVAAIGGLAHAAAFAAAPQRPRAAIHLPQRREEYLRVVRIEREVDGADVVVAKEDALPRPAAVARPIDAALFVRAIRMAQGRGIHNIGIGGIDAQPRDHLRVLQADVCPGLAAVGRLVDAVALDGVAAQLGFAGADVHNVGIRFGDGDGADGRARDLAISDRTPGGAAIRGLPQAAAGSAEVILERAPPFGPTLRQRRPFTGGNCACAGAAKARVTTAKMTRNRLRIGSFAYKRRRGHAQVRIGR